MIDTVARTGAIALTTVLAASLGSGVAAAPESTGSWSVDYVTATASGTYTDVAEIIGGTRLYEGDLVNTGDGCFALVAKSNVGYGTRVAEVCGPGSAPVVFEAPTGGADMQSSLELCVDTAGPIFVDCMAVGYFARP